MAEWTQTLSSLSLEFECLNYDGFFIRQIRNEVVSL